MSELIENIDIEDIDLLNNRSIAIGSTHSGKTYTITNIIFDNLINTNEDIKVIVFSGSFTDFDIFFRAIIYYTLRRQGVVINSKLSKEIIDSIDNFKIMDKLTEKELKGIIHNCNKIINNVLNNYIRDLINYLQKQNIDMTTKLKTKATFEFKNDSEDFNEYLNSIKSNNTTKTKNKLDIITNKYIQVLDFEKIIFLFDDIESEVNTKIKKGINFLFEQGRHKNVAVVFIDQYIKSPKISPLVRNSSKYIIFRSIGKSDMEYIISKITTDVSRLELKLQKCIDERYCVILFESRIYKFKARESLFVMFKNN